MKIEKNQIILGDCLENLKLIDDNIFDVAFTSPPYADKGSQSYEKSRKKGKCNNPYGVHVKYINVESHYGEEWLKWQIEIIDQLLRVCKKWIIYNIGAISNNRENVYKLIGHYADRIHDDIIWYKPNGLPCPNDGAISNTYEHILLIKKNPKDKIKVHTNGFRNVINKIGVNSENKFADIHNAVMNKKLSDVCIYEFTDINDFVIDPFMGMGTTAMSCIDLKRNYFGFEICKEYYDKCIERINIRKMLNDPFECES